MMLSLISVSVPGFSQAMQTALLGVIYMDVLQTDKWLPLILPETPEGQEELDTPLNAYFEMNGYSSKSVILNMGSTFVFIIIFALVHMLALILTPCARKYPR
jgi:hypothetical protein